MAFDFMKMLGLGQKRPNYQAVDPYAEVRPLLLQAYQQGQPEWKNIWSQQYQDVLKPDILETTRAKRNLGMFGSTPEAYALEKGGRNLMSELSSQDLQGRLQALGMLSRAVPTYMPEEVTTPMQDLMGLLLPSAVQMGSQWMTNKSAERQAKEMADVYRNFLGGGNANEEDAINQYFWGVQ